MRAVIYGRSSTAKEKSITDQVAGCRLAAAAQGWTVAAELSDPVSASRYSRKIRENWSRLLTMLPTLDAVVLWEPSRGDRSLASWATFLDDCRTHEVKIHAVSHNRTYDPGNARDYRSLAEDGVDSAYESDRLSGRVKRGKASAAASGKPAGKTCYGLERVYDPHTRDYVAQRPHPDQAAVVQRIFREVAAGTPISRITRDLMRDQIPPAQGGAVWRRTTITAMVKRAAYRPYPGRNDVACREHHGTLFPATWPPLVDEATWAAAHAALAARPDAPTKRPGSVRHLLSGSVRLMVCPCGSALSGRPRSTLRGMVREPAYTCSGDWCVSAPMADLDEYVTQLVVARLSKKDARHLWVADTTGARSAADELARLRTELEEARASFAAPGGISAAALAMKEQAMAPAMADAERRARPAGAPLAALKLLDAAKIGKDRVRPAWESLPITAKREVIAGLFSSLRLGPVTVRINRWTAPEERLAIVAERITHEWRKP